mmetsp:Transcript_49425/g.120646  ORF Transcript_49425/g.120646 Transcript_49425/m.120646 type:complete len:205 (-) Transcript_49425:381-995(-)
MASPAVTGNQSLPSLYIPLPSSRNRPCWFTCTSFTLRCSPGWKSMTWMLKSYSSDVGSSFRRSNISPGVSSSGFSPTAPIWNVGKGGWKSVSPESSGTYRRSKIRTSAPVGETMAPLRRSAGGKYAKPSGGRESFPTDRSPAMSSTKRSIPSGAASLPPPGAILASAIVKCVAIPSSGDESTAPDVPCHPTSGPYTRLSGGIMA